jgi:integrase/recombinase XerD
LEFIEQFLSDVKAQNSFNTFLTYRQALKLLEIFLKKNHKNLNLSKADALGFRRYLLEKELSKRSVNNRLAGVSSFYRWLVDNEHIEKNPFELKGLRLKVPESLPKSLTLDQLDIILSLLEGQKRLAIFSLASWGLRISEFGSAKVGDVSFAEDGAAKIKIKGKGEKERITISCFKKFDEEIKQWVSNREMTSSLFNLKVNQVKFLCKKLSGQLGFKFSPHSFRHTYATHLSKKGVDIKFIQKLLGHAKIDTTMIYTRIELPDIEKSIAAIKNSLGFKVV